jgi:hypothetical protein
MAIQVRDGSPESVLAAIQSVLANPEAFSQEFERIELGEWAAIKVHLPLEQMSSIRPAFMEAFIELQRQVYQLAAVAKTGSPNTTGLSDGEKEDLQISVVVTDGSSNYLADLAVPLQKLLSKMIGKMTGKQAVVVILSVAGLIAASHSFAVYLDHTKEIKAEELKSKDHLEALSAIEFSVGEHAKTIHEITEVLKTQGEIGKQAIEAVTATNDALLKAAAHTPKTVINGTEITRQEAQVLRTPTRRRSESVPVIKRVKVIDINTEDIFDLQIVLVDVETDAHYRIRFKDSLFAGADRHKLFQALEDRKPIWTELSIKEVEGEIRSVDLLRTTDGPGPD